MQGALLSPPALRKTARGTVARQSTQQTDEAAQQFFEFPQKAHCLVAGMV